MTNRDIYDQHIAPLVTQIHAIAIAHKFSYITIVQYNTDDTETSPDIGASWNIEPGCNEIIKMSWRWVNDTIAWEKPKEEERPS